MQLTITIDDVEFVIDPAVRSGAGSLEIRQGKRKPITMTLTRDEAMRLAAMLQAAFEHQPAPMPATMPAPGPFTPWTPWNDSVIHPGRPAEILS